MVSKLVNRRVVVAGVVLLSFLGWLWVRHDPELKRPLLERGRHDAADASTRLPKPAEASSGPDLSVHEPDREPLRKAACVRSRVVSHDQAAIPGAQVSWTPIFPAWIADSGAWPDLDWAMLEGRTSIAITNPEGWFEFAEPPPSEGARSSVIWLTASGYDARRVLLEFPLAPACLPPIIEMQSGGSLEVSVLDRNERQVVGCRVIQLTYLGKDDPDLGVGGELDAVRVLRRTYSTDASGRVALPSFPGLNWIWAEDGPWISQAWAGRAPSRFTLELRSTFTARGHVIAPPGAALEAMLGVRSSIVQGPDSHTLTRSRVNPDGSWGPAILPVLPCDKVLFQLEGTQVTNEQVSRSPPGIGDAVVVDFHPDPAAGFSVHVLDERDENIAGASVLASWYAKDCWHSATRCADAGGLARIGGCHRSVMYVTVSAKGHAQKKTEFELKESLLDPVVLKLGPSGKIKGRCTHRDAPVSAFRIHWWREPAYEGNNFKVNDSVDGSFVVEDVPLGEVCLIASSEGHPQSKTARVTVTSDRPAEIELCLPDDIVGRGTVLDGVTGQPVSNATIQLSISDRGTKLQKFRGLRNVDSQGAFEIGGFMEGTNVFDVSAPGYQTREVVRDIAGGPAMDFGLIPLFAKQALEVELLPEGAVELDRFRAELISEVSLPSRDFPANGVLRYEGLDPGPYMIRIHYPGDLSFQDVAVHVVSDREGRVRVAVTNRRMGVEVIPEPGRVIPEGLTLRLTYLIKSGEHINHCYGIPASGNVDVMAMDGTVAVEVVELDGTCLGFERAVVNPGSSTTLHVRLGGRPVVFRILDSSRKELAGQLVGLHCAVDCAGWYAVQLTDAQGICRFPGMPFEEALVSVGRLPEGIMPSFLLDLKDSGDDPIDIEFAPDCPLEVLLLERGKAMPGVEVKANDARVSESLGLASSDENGKATFCRVGKGNWQILVTHPGYWPDRQSVSVPCDGIPIPIEVRRLGSVDLGVTTATGNPVDHIAIDLYSQEKGKWVSEWIASGLVAAPLSGLRTNSSGKLRINGLPNGSFLWRVALPNGEMLEGDVTIPPQAVAQVEASLP